MKIDVRKIVLTVVEANPEAAKAYLTEPAMRHGVEITIGVLGRAAEVLITHGGHTPDQAAHLIGLTAMACSKFGGLEKEQIIAAMNTELFVPPCVEVMDGVHERRYGTEILSRHRAADCENTP